MQLKNLRIKTKLLLLIFVLSVVTISVAAVGISRLFDANRSLAQVDEVGDRQLLGARMNQNLIILNRSEYRIAADPSADNVASATEVNMSNRKVFEDRLRQISATATPDEAATLARIKDIYATYLKGADLIIDLARKDGGKAALSDVQQALVGKVKESRVVADKLQAEIKTYVDTLDKKAQSVSDGAKAEGSSAIIVMSAIAGIGTVSGILIGYLLATLGISSPLNRSVGELNKLAAGDLSTEVTGTDRGDECGDVAKGLEVFRANALRARDLEAEAAAQKHRAEQDRKQVMRDMADQFEHAVGSIVEMVSSAATEMQATAQQLTASAQETSAQSVAVSAAAEEAATNVSSVASAAEELGGSVNEIGRQVDRSSKLSQEAVAEAGTTAAIVSDMTQGAARIGDIVDLIAGIAGQTNLLALNATIEAARAGVAGRGFAVVASEVKSLAEQTAKATSDISSQIVGIQTTTSKAVAAIDSISGTIKTINEAAGAIAASVEQQGAATREIVQSVTQASAGASEVTSNISGVARAAEETGSGAAQMLTASSELARQAETLRSEVRKFLATVRAA